MVNSVDLTTVCHGIGQQSHPGPQTLDSAHNLAEVLRALGEHEQARTLIEDIFTRRRRILGDDHPDTLRTAAALAESPPAFGETR